VDAARRAISVLVVDDEAPARRRLTELLARDGDIVECREADNGEAAVRLLHQFRPDIVFLDVQMPGVDGFGVVEAIGAENMPLTVFVTAYDRFALQAFEANATDYLLKPFSDRRFEGTVERLKSRLRDPVAGSAGPDPFGPELLKLVARRSVPGEIWRWIVIKDRDSTRLVMADSVDYIEAAGVYVTIHAAGEAFLYRAGLATLAERLDPFQFVRIHRSTIVNLRSVTLLERRSHGEFDVLMQDGTRVTMSRTYRGHFEELLGQPL
jgi:two-component system, LytTR family, response regulator